MPASWFVGGQEGLESARLSVSSPGRSLSPRPPSAPFLFFLLRAFVTVQTSSPRTTRPAYRTLSYQGTAEIMPVQTQSRNQPVTTSDPFGDPNAIRVVPPVPPKVPSKRDTGMDNQRELTNARNQDPHRAKPIRSQTQQTVRSVDSFLLCPFQQVLIISGHPLATVVPKSLLVAPCLKTLPRCRLSQKSPSPPSVARRAPPMRTLSIASIFQALGLVRLRSCFPPAPHQPQNPATNFSPQCFITMVHLTPAPPHVIGTKLRHQWPRGQRRQSGQSKRISGPQRSRPNSSPLPGRLTRLPKRGASTSPSPSKTFLQGADTATTIALNTQATRVGPKKLLVGAKQLPAGPPSHHPSPSSFRALTQNSSPQNPRRPSHQAWA